MTIIGKESSGETHLKRGCDDISNVACWVLGEHVGEGISLVPGICLIQTLKKILLYCIYVCLCICYSKVGDCVMNHSQRIASWELHPGTAVTITPKLKLTMLP